MKVNQINVNQDMKVSDLLNQFDESGVLGAGKVARACNILVDMILDEDMSVFLSLGGPLIPGGMRNIVTKMIDEGHVDLIVASGANITHDLVEAFGGSHYRHEGRLRHPDRRSGQCAVSWTGAAHRAGTGAVWQSVPRGAG